MSDGHTCDECAQTYAETCIQLHFEWSQKCYIPHKEKPKLKRT